MPSPRRCSWFKKTSGLAAVVDHPASAWLVGLSPTCCPAERPRRLLHRDRRGPEHHHPSDVRTGGPRTSAVRPAPTTGSARDQPSGATCSAAPSGAPAPPWWSGSSAVVFGMLVGGSLSGMMAGFLRGARSTAVFSFIFLVLLSFPALILAILITSLRRPHVCSPSRSTLGILGVAPVGRLVARGDHSCSAEREFVLAAHHHRRQTLVASSCVNCCPNVVIPMGALALLGMAVAIVAEGGSGLPRVVRREGDTVSWGTLIRDGSTRTEVIEEAPWVAHVPDHASSF